MHTFILQEMKCTLTGEINIMLALAVFTFTLGWNWGVTLNADHDVNVSRRVFL